MHPTPLPLWERPAATAICETRVVIFGRACSDVALVQDGGVDQRGLPRMTPLSPNPDIDAVERQYPEVVILRNGFDSQ